MNDKYGRTFSLKITPILISIPTLLFSLLPTHAQIGIFALAILVFLRIFQGICIGGEFANNLVYLCETAHPKNLYFMGSIGACTGSLGICLASLIASICFLSFSADFLLAYGWRIAFLLSLPFGITTYLLRKKMLETKIFEDLSNNKLLTARPILDSIKNQWQDYLIALGITFLPATAFYYVFMFLQIF